MVRIVHHILPEIVVFVGGYYDLGYLMSIVYLRVKQLEDYFVCFRCLA
jgi:hypothetical protein